MALDWEPKTLKKELQNRGDADKSDLPQPVHSDKSGYEFYKCKGIPNIGNSCNRAVRSKDLTEVKGIPETPENYICNACIETLARNGKGKAAMYSKEALVTKLGAPTDFVEDLVPKLLEIANRGNKL